MKLLNELFEILESSGRDSGFSVTIRIAPDHMIYKGHFPGHPVTPGVILIQMVQELIELHLKKTIRLIEMPNCKFLKIVNPETENMATVSVDIASTNGFLQVRASGQNSSGIFFKLNAIYN